MSTNNNSTNVAYDWSYVCGVPLHILKCGGWASNAKEREIFMIIPGNPGCMGFYETFAKSLYAKSGIPVWGIAHTGHTSVAGKQDADGTRRAKIKQHPSREDCGLVCQIDHKVTFLREEVVPNVDKVYLVGHSIGCYIILHILHRMNEPKLEKGIMLFPTIERMAVTPNGKWMTPALLYARWAFVALAWMVSKVPFSMRKWLVNYLYQRTGQSSCDTILHQILCPKVADSSTYMAAEEMLMVLDRDDDILRRHTDKLIFYYGSTDHWCPVSYYEDMKRDYQDMNLHLCKRGYKHAFVLHESEEVASIVADMIVNN